MANKRWSDLDPRIQRFLVVAGTAEGVAKLAALRDLRRRRADQVNGSKKAWALGLLMINGFGIAPATYFIAGRR
jgi:hypothetical protein